MSQLTDVRVWDEDFNEDSELKYEMSYDTLVVRKFENSSDKISEDKKL